MMASKQNKTAHPKLSRRQVLESALFIGIGSSLAATMSSHAAEDTKPQQKDPAAEEKLWLPEGGSMWWI